MAIEDLARHVTYKNLEPPPRFTRTLSSLQPLPPSEMVAPHLPQEIVDEIIDKLVGDRQSLLSCSIVSTDWVDRSRHHLFAHLKLRSIHHLQSWFGTSLGRFSHHVRSLVLAQDDESKWITPDALATIFNDFASFHNVVSLTLANLDLTLFDEHSLNHFFGHFSEHLTSLTVKRSTVNPETLLFFVCMFPKLDNLKLNSLVMGNTTMPSRRHFITPRFRGKLTLLNIKADGTPMTAPFVDPPLPMAFKELCVENCRFESPKSLRDLFIPCQETAKAVKVSRIYLGAFRSTIYFTDVSCLRNIAFSIPTDDTSETPLIDLSPFKGLEEVGLSLIHLRKPSRWIEQILRTITSTRVRKITFDADFPCSAAEIDSGIDLPSWTCLDAMFLTMANRLDGTGEKLEIVFNALNSNVIVEFRPLVPGRFLEKCRTKATVRFGRAPADRAMSY